MSSPHHPPPHPDAFKHTRSVTHSSTLLLAHIIMCTCIKGKAACTISVRLNAPLQR